MFLIPILFALLSPDVPVTQPVLGAATNVHGGAVATAGDRSLAVWMDFRGSGDVYAARIDASGNVLDPAGIVLYHGQAQAAVAPMPSGDFLVALAQGGRGETDVVRVTRDGAVTPPKKIDDTGSLATNGVQMATNGTNFLVLSSGQRVLMIDGDGNVLAGPYVIGQFYGHTALASDGRDYLIVNIVGPSVEALPVSAGGQLGTPQFPLAGVNPSALALASDGTRYFVAAAGINAMQTAILGGDGKVLNGTQATISARASDVRAAWDGKEYALVWAVHTSTQNNDATLYAAFADSLGRAFQQTTLGKRVNGDSSFDVTPLAGHLLLIHGEAFGLFGTLPFDGNVPDFAIARTATPQNAPILAAVPGGAVVVWREGNFRAERLDAEGRPAGKVVDVVDGAADSVHVAFDGANVVVSWRAEPQGTLYAQRYTPSLDPLDAVPIRIATNVSTVRSLAAGGGVSLFVWTLADDSPWNSETDSASHGAVLTSSGVVVPVAVPEVFVAGAGWNGSEFLVSYAVATGPWPSQGFFPDPPCDVEVLRVAPNGALLDAGVPHAIAHLTTYVEAFAVASNGGSFLVAWKPDLFQRFGTPSIIAGVTVNADGTAASAPRPLSSEGVSEGPFLTPYLGTYAVAWTTAPSYDTRTLQWRTTSSDTTESLPPAMVSYDAHGAAAVAIGPRLVFAYPRIDASPNAAGVLRVFVRSAATTARRRASAHD